MATITIADENAIAIDDEQIDDVADAGGAEPTAAAKKKKNKKKAKKPSKFALALSDLLIYTACTTN